ncbi:hypothetical protein [Salibacterium aidingense]|uniref:hypothetical protein n=1 Tax=Salibacterium aidingense TaxID=384933 RepID=UPI00042271AC|nr:hypothetical protein [Salibacterium aidingense]
MFQRMLVISLILLAVFFIGYYLWDTSPAYTTGFTMPEGAVEEDSPFSLVKFYF